MTRRGRRRSTRPDRRICGRAHRSEPHHRRVRRRLRRGECARRAPRRASRRVAGVGRGAGGAFRRRSIAAVAPGIAAASGGAYPLSGHSSACGIVADRRRDRSAPGAGGGTAADAPAAERGPRPTARARRGRRPSRGAKSTRSSAARRSRCATGTSSSRPMAVPCRSIAARCCSIPRAARRSQGLKRLAEILVARVQSALDEQQFEAALQALETVRSIDPNDTRLPALDERIAKMRDELGPAEIQAAINAQNFERAAQLIDQAARAKSMSEAKLASAARGFAPPPRRLRRVAAPRAGRRAAAAGSAARSAE